MPRNAGDCVVILFIDPGPNLLARYFPPFKVNDFLLSEADWSRQGTDDNLSTVSESAERTQDVQEQQHGDLYDGVVLPVDALDLKNIEKERYDVMDLASFLECALWDH